MHPQSNGVAECMVQTIKKAAAIWDRSKETFHSFISRFLLNFRSIPHFGKSGSPSQLMERQIRNPITFKYTIQSPIWYVPTLYASKEEAMYMAEKGSNTAYIMKKNGTLSVAHEDQICAQEMEQITPIQTVSEGDGPNSMDLSNNESSMDAGHRTQPAILEAQN